MLDYLKVKKAVFKRLGLFFICIKHVIYEFATIRNIKVANYKKHEF